MPFGCSWLPFGCSGLPFLYSWLPVGAFWAPLGASWAPLGASWAPLGASWGDLKIQVRNWSDFGSPKGAKREPKGSQNGTKMEPKTDQNRRQISTSKKAVFKTVLGPSWGDLGSFSVSPGVKHVDISLGFICVFEHSRFSIKYRFKNHLGPNLARLGSILAPKMEPKWHPKATPKRFKNMLISKSEKKLKKTST